MAFKPLRRSTSGFPSFIFHVSRVFFHFLISFDRYGAHEGRSLDLLIRCFCGIAHSDFLSHFWLGGNNFGFTGYFGVFELFVKSLVLDAEWVEFSVVVDSG